MKALSILIGLLVVSAGAYVYLANAPAQEAIDNASGETAHEQPTGGDPAGTSMMYAEENAVMVPEQRPGTTITGTILLAAPGYLVIHEDNNGAPGAIIGSSSLLPAGESGNVTVTLSRASKEGEKLHAMLHAEKGGNTTFSAAEDTPVPSTLGGPIMGFFDIAADAPDLPVISI